MNTIYRLISTIIDLTSLDRYGKQSSSTYGKIDDLTCSYDGNHLTAISDNAPTPTISGSFDFKDSTGVSTEYLYDANGNMKKDVNKGISQIQYNHLNLPSRITYSNGRVINYVYSARGTKLKVTHKPSGIGITTTTDYVNGYIFTNNSLSMALTDNGYYTLSSTGDPTYYFYLKDHQGNNRVVVTQNDSIVQTNHYYPYGALFAESTNGDVQRFKYNGKELDRTFGLDNYDIHARQYFAMAPMWDRIDPLTEENPQFSPYSYCMGDPVNYIDRNGMQPGLLEEMYFAISHPIETSRIGVGVTNGAQNICTNATRFATRGNILYGSRLEEEDRGSEAGAYRHALWQATIASEFGTDIAKQVGDAHEINPNINMNQTVFETIDEADQSADLHNNIIGREIGDQNQGKGMKTIAIAVLDVFFSNGLFEVQKYESGYILVKTKLNPSKYKVLLNTFKLLNDNARYENEQQQYDAQQEDRAKRYDAMQNAM